MKLVTLVLTLTRRLIASPNARQYIAANQATFARPSQHAKRQVMINRVHSYPPIELYAQASNYLARTKDAAIFHYHFESERLDRLGLPHPVLTRIFASIGSYAGLNWNWWRWDSPGLIWTAVRTFRTLNTKEDVLALQIERVPVGTLIYDTYLRRYRQETLPLKSWGLLWILVQAQVIARRTRQYFSMHEVVSLFPGDVAYLYSGIVARTAILQGIPTYSVVESPCRLQPMDLSFYRRVPFWHYRERFAALSPEEQGVAKIQAAKLIEARLGGNTDESMAYMRESAFAEQSDDKRALMHTDRPKILVLLHDFFDSPHIYRHMLFADFWEWICFTLEHASRTDFEWYVKPHPNGLPGNDRIVNRLKARFPRIHFIDPKTSNRQLIDEGLAAVFSVYGSAGHEFPYLGIPVVMAGDNPHIAYDFTFTPKTQEEYRRLIHQAGEIICAAEPDQLREFYYMHYCHYQSELPLNPTYPPTAYCQRLGIEDLSSKEQRIRYHKADTTLAYLLEQRTPEQQYKLKSYFQEVFG
jgi:hypothetical protein